jgi:drug/metabolite transporter (DMT)-like permease
LFKPEQTILRGHIIMKYHDIIALLSLGAIWGSSYVFMRLGAGEFGALPLAGVRAAGAALVLLPVLLMQKQLRALAQHWKPVAIVGLMNSALPFVLFNFAALHIAAGLSSVFSAASPLFAGLVALIWMKDRLPSLRWFGLVIGFAGVFGLAFSKAQSSLVVNNHQQALAVGACLLAALLYGVSVNFTKKYLSNVPSMAVAAGSQLSAAIILAPFAMWAWPETNPSNTAWGSVIALAVLCSAVAYVLFFRLIANTGPTKASAVAFLVPVFGVLWGAVFLGEVPTAAMATGCAVILVGTAFGTGLLAPRAPRVLHRLSRGTTV